MVCRNSFAIRPKSVGWGSAPGGGETGGQKLHRLTMPPLHTPFQRLPGWAKRGASAANADPGVQPATARTPPTPHLEGPVLGLMLCCCCLEIPNFWTKGLAFSFGTRPHKSYSQSCGSHRNSYSCAFRPQMYLTGLYSGPAHMALLLKRYLGNVDFYTLLLVNTWYFPWYMNAPGSNISSTERYSA